MRIPVSSSLSSWSSSTCRGLILLSQKRLQLQYHHHNEYTSFTRGFSVLISNGTEPTARSSRTTSGRKNVLVVGRRTPSLARTIMTTTIKPSFTTFLETMNTSNSKPKYSPYHLRSFSASSSSSSSNLPAPVGGFPSDGDDNFQALPPEQLTDEIADGIQEATKMYIKYGAPNQRLVMLSKDINMPIIQKWQKMMQIFLATQVHVISGLGYTTDEDGLTLYAKALAKCMESMSDTSAQIVMNTRKETWRILVGTTFGLNINELPTISVVDARNLMHKISSKMIEPQILMDIHRETSNISDEDPIVEVSKKHMIMQDFIVNRIYLGGSPRSLVEEAGYGTGAQGYAKLQCALSEHETDPLIAQYAAASLKKIWDAAGLDVNDIAGPGMGISTT